MDPQQNLTTLADALLSEAAEAPHGRSSRTVVHGDRLRAVLLGFSPGAGLGEHEAPPAATFHVLRGRALLKAGDEQWDVGAGELVPIPPARHSVEVPTEPTVLLLTVAID